MLILLHNCQNVPAKLFRRKLLELCKAVVVFHCRNILLSVDNVLFINSFWITRVFAFLFCPNLSGVLKRSINLYITVEVVVSNQSVRYKTLEFH